MATITARMAVVGPNTIIPNVDKGTEMIIANSTPAMPPSTYVARSRLSFINSMKIRPKHDSISKLQNKLINEVSKNMYERIVQGLRMRTCQFVETEMFSNVKPYNCVDVTALMISTSHNKTKAPTLIKINFVSQSLCLNS